MPFTTLLTLLPKENVTKSYSTLGTIKVIKRSPDNAKIKHKMVYASSKDAIRKKLDGIYTEVQATDLAELSYESVLDKVISTNQRLSEFLPKRIKWLFSTLNL